MNQPSALDRARSVTRMDLSPRHRPPTASAVVAAAAASVGLSLLADALLVVVGEAIFPGDTGYPHFRFGDYAVLTVIGVLLACAAWPVVTRLTSAPRWVFLRLAVVVSAVALVPDLAIFLQGQPGRAVIVLVCMHLAIGLITYNLLVRVARPRSQPDGNN